MGYGAGGLADCRWVLDWWLRCCQAVSPVEYWVPRVFLGWLAVYLLVGVIVWVKDLFDR